MANGGIAVPFVAPAALALPTQMLLQHRGRDADEHTDNGDQYLIHRHPLKYLAPATLA